MKKKLNSSVLIVFTFCVSQLSFNQTTFGIKGGGNGANFKNRQVEYLGGSYNRLGYHAGVLSEIFLGENFFVKPEILYSLKGWRSKSQDGISRARISFDYIDFPLLLGYRLGEKVSILAGSQIGYLWRARSRRDGEFRSITSQFKRLDVAISAGAAYKVSARLGAELRYAYGLRKIHSIPSIDLNGATRYLDGGLNRVLQASVYYLLKR